MEKEFIENGYVIGDIEDLQAFQWISRRVFQITTEFLSIQTKLSEETFFNNIHEYIQLDKLNSLRLAIINTLTTDMEFKEKYYALAKTTIDTLVGNELAIQKGLGLNIQLPHDDSALLPLHSDIWGSECSPFEVVLWLPLVDCYRSKSICILPPEKDRYWRNKLHEFQSMEDMYQVVKNDLVWVDIQRGQFLLFTHTILHGNRINKENSARWSVNIRFKSLFSPYAGKGFGEYFQPLRIKPVTKIAMQFQFPRVDISHKG